MFGSGGLHMLSFLLLCPLFSRVVFAQSGSGMGSDGSANNGACMQPSLLYGTTPHIPTWQHICCQVPQHYAEPAGFQEWSGINFFTRLENMQQAMESGSGSVAEAAGVDSLTGTYMQWNEATGMYEFIFYDSQCGLPLYIAPRGRSYDAWKKESIDHGWPSFRDEEVVMENIDVIAGGEVVSKCPGGAQTHQGHRFEDYHGYRYCIDLLCMAGHATDGIDLADYPFNDSSMRDMPSLAERPHLVGLLLASVLLFKLL
mmetsp:Transcript_20336/g.36981  ORF Transcript_20336/g.36981 Transcript_20336/m.36981 type:complete len:257 (-) Transcript_20336:84-854(-)